MKHASRRPLLAVLALAVSVTAQDASSVSSGPPPRASDDGVLLELQEGPFAVGLGDVDGDGFGDVAVSRRKLHADHPDRPNIVRVIKGPDGSEHFTLTGGPGFGYRLARSGDADGDGVQDLLVATGDLGTDRPEGRVELFSGADGTRIHEVPIADLAADLAGVDDVDGDGRADYALTAGSRSGVRVEVRSGHDGAVLWAVTRARDGYHATHAAVVSTADVDGDGVRDLALIGPRTDGSGDAWSGCLTILSGATGREIRPLGGPEFSAGESPEALSASTGGEFLVVGGSVDGAPVVRVVSPYDGRTIHEVSEDTPHYGWATAAPGDIDGDGTPDFAVGAPPFQDRRALGRVFVHSGATGALLRSWSGGTDEDDPVFPGRGFSFGICLDGAGDFDGDGHADLLAGEARGVGSGRNVPDRLLVVTHRGAQITEDADAFRHR